MPLTNVELEKEIVFRPAYDCIVNPCKFGSEECDKGGGGNHGRHCVDMTWFLKGPDLVIQFSVSTGWALPETPAEKRMSAYFPMASDLGYHSRTKLYADQAPMDKCDFFGDGCYYDGSSMNATKGLEILTREGSDAVWAWMEGEWKLRDEQRLEMLKGASDAPD